MSLNGLLVAIMMRRMLIQMNDRHLQTLSQLQACLDSTNDVDFTLAPAERYGFIEVSLRAAIQAKESRRSHPGYRPRGGQPLR